MQHVQNPVPRLSEARPGLPTSLDALLLKALAKAPEDRFADANSFLDALARVRADAVSAVSGGPGRAAGLAGAAGATAGMGGAGRAADDPGATAVRAGRRRGPGAPPASEDGGHAAATEVRPPQAPRPRRGTLAAVLFTLAVLVAVAVSAWALTSADPADPPEGTLAERDEGTTTSAPPETTATTAAPTTETTAPATTAPPTTAPPAEPPTTAPEGEGDGGEGSGSTVLGVAVGEPVDVTTFGATIRLPQGWQMRGANSTETLRTVTGTGPRGAAVRVDENLAWTGGAVDLEPDARRLEAGLYSRYPDMQTIAMEPGEFKGARALRWEFVHSASSGRLHKIDLFFQRDAETRPAAILVTWPEGNAEAEREARAVLDSLEF
jgi:hypothetical protein